MILKDEERFLAQCLKSVADVVDEIVVVDTGSTDRTIEIARSFGAIVVERPWRKDFAWARNESLALATKRWILFLDADEELTPESKPALRQLKDVPAYHAAVWVRCFNRSDDYSGTGDMSHALIRIFPNTPEIRFRGLIHEFPCLNGSQNGLEAAVAPISIVHYGYLKAIVAERNKGERNLDIVRAATLAEPTDPFHWFNLGTTAFLIGRYEEARDAFEHMRELNGTTQRGFIPNGYAILAEIYSDKLGQPVRAEEVARNALKVAPRYANAHFQLGKALVAQGRYDEAREAYLAAIADGEFAHLQFVIDDQVYIWKAKCEIGSTYVMQGNDAAAIEWFEKARTAVPTVEPVQINLARSLERLGRVAEAEEVFRTAYQTHRSDMATVDYVNALLRAGKGLQALEIIAASHPDLSDDAAVALLLAAAQISSKNSLPDVERYLWAAQARAPGNADVLNPLEELLRARGDDAGLARLRDQERETAPTKPADFLRRSFRAIAVSDFSDALTLAEGGVSLAPTDALLRYNAAIAAMNLKEYATALAHLDFVTIDHREAFDRAELLRVAAYRALDRSEEALVVLERLLARAPQLDALVVQAGIFEANGNVEAAERSLREATALDPQQGAVELAGFYVRVGRFSDAARVAEKALTDVG